MATKLTSSLRKSISAEKQSIENKSAPDPEVAKPTPKAQPVRRKTTATTPKQTIIEPAAQETTISKVVAKVVAKDKIVVDEVKSVEQEKQKPVSAQNVLNKIASSNQKLSSAFVENLVSVSNDVNDYLRKMSEIKDFAKLQELNLEFVAMLRKRQQDLINNNIDWLSQFNIKIPKI